MEEYLVGGEDSLDPVTRVRRGRLYRRDGQQGGRSFFIDNTHNYPFGPHVGIAAGLWEPDRWYTAYQVGLAPKTLWTVGSNMVLGESGYKTLRADSSRHRMSGIVKRYPKYKDSGVEWIGEVPEYWGVKPICRMVSCNDDSLPENVQPDQVLRYVDISSINHRDGITEVAEIRFASEPSRARRKAKAGDTVISTVRTYLKAVAAVTEPYADCTFSTGFAVLRPRSSEVEPGFLKWVTINDLVIQAIEAHSEGLSYPAINATELVKLKVVVPPPTEQTMIAAALDRETAFK